MSTPKKLLIVDDSQTSRQVMRHIVARFRRKWSMFESDNGTDAIDMIAMINPDFVMMDVNMPGMSGLDSAERIRAAAPGIRIALVTANLQEAVRRRAGELGFGFVEKPVNEEKISEAIRFFEAEGATQHV